MATKPEIELISSLIEPKTLSTAEGTETVGTPKVSKEHSEGMLEDVASNQQQQQQSHLTPKRRAKGKFHYPTAGLFSASLKIKIKIFFSFRNCKKLCNKAQNAIISLSFPSYMNWQPPENQLCIGERARREVA